MSKEEHYLQLQIVEYLKYNKILVFAVPNGGSRNALEGANLKKEGVLAGVSDLIIILKNRVVFVEIKTQKGKQQESQKLFENQIKKHNLEYYIWRNLEEAVEFVKNNLYE